MAQGYLGGKQAEGNQGSTGEGGCRPPRRLQAPLPSSVSHIAVNGGPSIPACLTPDTHCLDGSTRPLTSTFLWSPGRPGTGCRSRRASVQKHILRRPSTKSETGLPPWYNTIARLPESIALNSNEGTSKSISVNA